jgi:hypothetical protein
MKKHISLMFFVIFTALFSVACQGGRTPGNYFDTATNNLQHEALRLNIALASDELLGTFNRIHEVDYRFVHAGFDAINSTVNLAIWANVPLRNFALLTFANDIVDENFVFIPIATFGNVSEFLPGEVFVVNSYFGMGTLPWSGVTFIDGNGEHGAQRYFAMIQNQADEGDPWLIWEFGNPKTGILHRKGLLQNISMLK